MTPISSSGDAICLQPLSLKRDKETGRHRAADFCGRGRPGRLSEVALKAFLALMKAWDLSNAEASALLGVSASTFDRVKRGYRPT